MNVVLQSKIQSYGSLTQEVFFHLQMKLQPSGISLNNQSCITSWAALLYSTPASFAISLLLLLKQPSPRFHACGQQRIQQEQWDPVTVSAQWWHYMSFWLTILVGTEAQSIQNGPHLPVSIYICNPYRYLNIQQSSIWLLFLFSKLKTG